MNAIGLPSMSDRTKFKAIHFHGRAAQVTLDKDLWGPFVQITFKTRGIYKILVKRFGSPDALLRKKIRVNNLSQRVIIRLPMGLSNACLENTWMKIYPLATTA